MECESDELFNLADALSVRVNSHRDLFQRLIEDMRSGFDRVKSAVDGELLAEEFARSLRRLWLEVAVESTSRNFRSPPLDEKTTTATGRNVDFGYERDLHPTYLEDRCRKFFDEPPNGWSSDHVLLSSGQSAMTAVLHTLEDGSLIKSDHDRRLSFIHFGTYFETAEIFSLFNSLLEPVACGRDAMEKMDDIDADVCIIEPVFCDGHFGCVDIPRLIGHHSQNDRHRVYIFDTTLSGTAYSVEKELDRIRALAPAAVFRLASGLKLFQGGLELSNVGILSVFTAAESAVSAKEIADNIRKIRTLLGLGLSFADVAALEAPWFLDRHYADQYQHAIFANNARLAASIAANNRLFDGTFHPSLLSDCQALRCAPYCAFRLKPGSPLTYEEIEGTIRAEVQKREMLLDSGGSFGFRGHRFEVVRPGDGTEPFLRVALGRRAGWSCDQTIQLICDLASGNLS